MNSLINKVYQLYIHINNKLKLLLLARRINKQCTGISDTLEVITKTDGNGQVM